MSDNFLLNNLIAHRGLHNNYIVENTLLSFLKAIEKKYIIELDVRLTKDNKVIVFHDFSLNRLLGLNKLVELCTYDEIKNMKLNNLYNIPLLEEVLRIVCDKVPIIIDVKGNTQNYNLEKELLNIVGKYKGRIAFQSFNPKTLKWLSKRYEACYGLIIFNYFHLKIFNKLFLRKKYNFIVCYKKYVKDNKIQKIRKKIPVIGWTIFNIQELDEYSDFCDNFICEKLS